MTTTEVKNIIAEAANSEWFATAQVTFNYSSIEQSLPLIGVSTIYEYVIQQLSGWEKYENLPNEFNSCKTYFTNIKKAIIQFVGNYKSTDDVNTLNKSWQNQVTNLIGNVSNRQLSYNISQNANNIPLPYNIPQVEFLLKVSQETPKYFSGAYKFVLGLEINLNDRDSLYGAILTYEFTLKDHTDITERRNAEKSSISKLWTDFQKYLSDSEQQLSKHLHNANTEYTEYVKKIDDLKSDKENLFLNWFEETKNETWQKWFDTTIQKIEDLEKTYQEKLKLEEPAKYWDNRAKALRKQGRWSFGIGVGLVILIGIFLSIVLLKTPEFIYASWFGEDKGTAIKWTVIYITLISFIAYALRALLKVMFSAFHLARDCEERHTLTYFYLSLLKDSKVDDKDRQLIMQSLFSRAETGLLKDDSSPTMPNDLISKFIPKS